MMTFIELLDRVGRLVERMPQMVATTVVNFSKQRFVEQAWHDEKPEAWEKRRKRRRGGEKRQNGAVLVDSGRLKRSIRKTEVSASRVVIGTDVPYAAIHNEGYRGTQHVKEHSRKRIGGKSFRVRAHNRKIDMPRRRFLGESAELAREIEDLIVTELTNAIQQ